MNLLEGLSFYVFRTDTNAVLARGIDGFEAAKSRANDLRKQYGLKWDQVKFKAERGTQSSVPGSSVAQRQPFGLSRDGRTFTSARGDTGRVDYARRFNPSKGRRFRGYTDAQGNYHDID
ncbi:hypothetical protein [Cyanobium sp. A2C-AMD]|uniref:hypothetical protein n=1 Tax=Cyanobium sp. A2C-AMD TaxID=2823695 RepID=UPI0020CE175E|nr:hypothetical protein [Cyanobium sp. A2C-AMD]MCP9878149.1 hypothetical protein [Cyanobium sp. A2C-AMD]